MLVEQPAYLVKERCFRPWANAKTAQLPTLLTGTKSLVAHALLARGRTMSEMVVSLAKSMNTPIYLKLTVVVSAVLRGSIQRPLLDIDQAVISVQPAKRHLLMVLGAKDARLEQSDRQGALSVVPANLVGERIRHSLRVSPARQGRFRLKTACLACVRLVGITVTTQNDHLHRCLLIFCICARRLDFMIRTHFRLLTAMTRTFILHERPQLTMQGALHAHPA